MSKNGSVDALRATLSGELMSPGDPGYHAAREVFNVMHDKRPALIARCATTADVVAAVDHAREHELLVAVRSGGHSVAGLSICDDGMLIDLAGLKDVDVDPAAKTARAGGGVLWGELDAATQEHGLHTPGGRVTTTGVGGFTTGGGYAWTSSKHGLTCDNLLSAEVVLADGSVVTASEHENEDLFWGIRGGGGNFGIVTEFTFRLHQLGPIVLAGLALWPLDHARDVLRGWRDIVDDAPDELSTACVILTAPPEEFVPANMQGRPAVGMAAIWVGDPAEGAPAIRQLKELGPTVDLIQPMPYTEFQAIIDPSAPKGYRSYWRGEYMGELTDAAIDVFLEHAPRLAAESMPFSQMIMFRIGQAVSAVDEEATAISNRSARYMFHPIVVWSDAADDERLIAAGRAFADAMRQFADGGAYLNFTAETDRLRDAYDEQTYARLVALKDKYDPENLFRLNQNIKPSGRAPAAA